MLPEGNKWPQFGQKWTRELVIDYPMFGKISCNYEITRLPDNDDKPGIVILGYVGQLKQQPRTDPSQLELVSGAFAGQAELDPLKGVFLRQEEKNVFRKVLSDKAVEETSTSLIE